MVVPDLAAEDEEEPDPDEEASEQAEVEATAEADVDPGPSEEANEEAVLDAEGEDIELVQLDDDDVTGDLFSGDETPETTEEATEGDDDPLNDPFFSGEETASGTGNQGDSPSSSSGSVDPAADAGGDEPPEHVQEAIINGASRMSVIGLEDHQKDDLQEEFRETFEMFQLGYFGGRVVEEHFDGDPSEMDPIWGFVGAALICAAVVVWKRPDGDEMVQNAKQRLSALGSGLGGGGSSFSKPDLDLPGFGGSDDEEDADTDENADEDD